MDSKQQLPAQLEQSFKLYKMRWVVLVVSVFTCASGNMQWMQYGIIGDVLVLYYGISFDAVNWTSMVFLLMYIIFLFPVSYILDKYGLRVGVIFGSVGTCLGAWIKLASASPDRFWVLLLGQSVAAVSQVFVLPTPPLLAATWFGANEVSMACGIGLSGCQVGVALGFVLPTIILKPQHDLIGIETDMFILALAVGIFCSIYSILTIRFFTDQPPSPPSTARSTNLVTEKTSSKQSIAKLFTSRSYVVLLLVYGIDIGVFFVLSTTLNQVVLKYYPDGSDDAGRIGCLITIAGTIISVVYGIILDRFKWYRQTLLATQLICSLMMFMVTFLLYQGIVFVYITYILLGAFLTSVMVIGYEMAAEVTYPEPEGTPAGLLNASAQGFGIMFTYLYSFLFYKLEDVWSNLSLCVILLVGFVLLTISPFDLKRQAINLRKVHDNQTLLPTNTVC
ncbi:hypothetical protein PPYR_09362 [Photinus pyralis]|uniref:Major facilitator superfamily (MFS) profile domain-containing protein n=1 Tax=Photinus pyralis TaxID=7054 RepID=A0A5N4AM11_PHOPY|nr:hypothetical protein PPYR_09362 [Photinus pyralis]